MDYRCAFLWSVKIILGEGCGRRNFPGDTIILLSNIDQIFETKRSAKESDHDWEKINIYCSWSNKFNIWWIHANAATFLTRIYITAFVFEFCNSALTHWLLCRPWRALAFHFWHHHFWPKLASSMLNFCRWKRFFQQYPDQSAQPNGAGDMHKKLSEELGAKFPAITRGFSMVKFAHLDEAFFEVFFNCKQAH